MFKIKICNLCGDEKEHYTGRYDNDVSWDEAPREYVERYQCSRCEKIKLNHPEMYAWVVDVIDNLKK